ncbi:MAG: (2Fe-2S)-binding protein [Pirellulales bacterium]|nr:(2Fe-2S)-binding protein [Pirellulales bacterium]
MPKITIDNREVNIPDGGTILDAARKLGIEIPTLCFLKGYKATTSCLTCVVKVNGRKNLVPACATVAEEGMEVESETAEVRGARRTALELLLSDHVGDCIAPCQLLCPAGMNIPQMLRQIVAGDNTAAVATVLRDIALPAVLARICTAPCEKGCRRGSLDKPIPICELKGYVADLNLAAESPWAPKCRPASGKRVAVVGGGPTGISAAFHLAVNGHAATVFEREPQVGGRILTEFGREVLPRETLEAEVEFIARMGVDFVTDTTVGGNGSSDFEHLITEFDAVLIAAGTSAHEQAVAWGLKTTERGLSIDKADYRASLSGVFAAGGAVRSTKLVVRSTADGKEAAQSIDRYLENPAAEAVPEPFTTKIGRMTREELLQLANVAESGGGKDMKSLDETQKHARDAAACLHCDCRGADNCELRIQSEKYQAGATQYHATSEQRRPVKMLRHKDRIVYEPGKCIRCGRCIAIVNETANTLGLTLIGRGFNVEVGVPFGRDLGEVFGRQDAKTADELAAKCIAACPTAALSKP